METKILLPRRYDFLLLFFLLLCAAAEGMSYFARVVGPAVAPKPDPIFFPPGKGAYSGIENHKTAKAGASVFGAHACPCFFGAGEKKWGSSMAVIMPLLNIRTCLCLNAIYYVVGVSSQSSGMMTQSLRSLCILLVVLGGSLLF